MTEFTTLLFKENELKTSNAKVLKDRWQLVSYLISAVGFLLYLLEIQTLSYIFFFSGFALFLVSYFYLSAGKIPSIGQYQATIKLTVNSIMLNNMVIEIIDREDLAIKIVGYDGELKLERTSSHQFHNGNENTMKIAVNGKELEFRFVLRSKDHKERLVYFCKKNGFNNIKENYRFN